MQTVLGLCFAIFEPFFRATGYNKFLAAPQPNKVPVLAIDLLSDP
jgi:hypothetical protein